MAMMFALSLVPVCIAAGAGLDLARAMIVRSQLAEALDSAGIAAGSSKGLSQSQIQALAQNYFNANYKLNSSYGTPSPVNVTIDDNKIKVSSSVDVPATLLNVIGKRTLPVSFESTVVWGQTKLWVALVLDNTGSMLESDHGTSKLDSLKSAAHKLLEILQNASANAGDVKVSIVPFNKDVNAGASFYRADWIDWSDWDSQNTTTVTVSCGGNGHHGSHNHNNCTQTVPKNHNSWNGCITDRDQDYDTDNTTPVASRGSTLFPAEQYGSCPLQLLPLTDDWSTLSDKIDAMYAVGNTNQTIGLAWGWQTLTDGDPMNAGALPENTTRVIILLSDGLNTENRWSTWQSSIDARETKACDAAKAAGAIIYTVFVDINGTSGNSAVLQSCASDSAKAFDLTKSSEITSTFVSIGEDITNLRVAK
ncbi:MAG: TadE/TadG family protein [Proteobacteria bacterium]|nr:TadE/TadG family protein [Pseudomonadota bacterium]